MAREIDRIYNHIDRLNKIIRKSLENLEKFPKKKIDVEDVDYLIDTLDGITDSLDSLQARVAKYQEGDKK